MLTPQDLLEIVDTLYPMLDELTTWITNDVIRRLMKRLERDADFLLTGTDVWQIEVYKEAGGHYDALQREIQRWTNKTEQEIRSVFEDAGLRAWALDDAFYVAQGIASAPLLSVGSEHMVKILTDTYQRTAAEMKNFTRTTAKASQQQFIDILDNAHFKVITGAQSYTAAVKDAVDKLVETQAEVLYPSGHRDTIETAVLRCVRTGVAQATGNMSMQGMIDRDWDLIRVSAHLGARYGDGGENPGNHFWWQGKIYSRTGRSKEYPPFEETTGYGTGEGLCGWNCRHSFGPGDPSFNPYQDFDNDENKKAYDLSQKQRALERQIRKSKREVMAYREALDAATDEETRKELQDSYTNAARELQRCNAVYEKFCDKNNLKKLADRVRVAKWNRSQAAKAAAAARKK